jgi:hypothetical protein
MRVTMLGDKLGEANGTLAGVRVLSVEEGSPKLEISMRGSGSVLGVAFTDMITYSQVVRPGGIYYGEGETVWLTEDGEVSTWKGFGVGKPTGPGFSSSLAVAGSVQTASTKLARLNGVATVVEYNTDESGNYHWTLWEWKGSAG